MIRCPDLIPLADLSPTREQYWVVACLASYGLRGQGHPGQRGTVRHPIVVLDEQLPPRIHFRSVETGYGCRSELTSRSLGHRDARANEQWVSESSHSSVLGVVYIFWSEKAKGSVARVAPDPPPP